MNQSNMISSLIFAMSALALASCKQEAGKRSLTPPDRSKAAKTFIVRVETEPSNKKANFELMSSTDDLKGASAAQVEKTFNEGRSLTLSEQEKGFMATDEGGNAFALNGCQGYNMPMGYYQYPYSAMPIGNIYNQGTIAGGLMNGGGLFGGGFGGIFSRILSALLGGGQGAGDIWNNLPQTIGQVFTGGNFMPVGLPYGQDGFQYGCGYPMPYGQSYPYPQPGFPQQGFPQQGYPQGNGPVGYPYMGQYQQGPYTYYTYGQQPGYQPVMQPVPQPGMQQPGMQQPGMQQPGMQQPGMQQPGMNPYTYGNPTTPYSYQPYPTTYNNGYTGP
jgi:hypothetical protein